MSKTWFITGISSGFGYELTKQLLESGNTVVGTVRNENSKGKAEELKEKYQDLLDMKYLDVTDVEGLHRVVKESFESHKKIDVVVNNAGYGLFGAAEELPEEEINKIIATNLTGPILIIKDVIPLMREQGGGRIIQLSSYGGQVAYPGNSLYHATKFGIEGFCESVAQEVADFGIGITIVEPGGARTEFRYSSARVAPSNPIYDGTPTHSFLKMLDPANGLAPGNPALMATRMIESVEKNPAPLRIVLGSQALKATIDRLEERIADYKTQTELAASTDYKDGE